VELGVFAVAGLNGRLHIKAIAAAFHRFKANSNSPKKAGGRYKFTGDIKIVGDGKVKGAHLKVAATKSKPYPTCIFCTL
jgi:hypothetical protein